MFMARWIGVICMNTDVNSRQATRLSAVKVREPDSN